MQAIHATLKDRHRATREGLPARQVQRRHPSSPRGHTPELLALAFQRIYTLRNQLMHCETTHAQLRGLR